MNITLTDEQIQSFKEMYDVETEAEVTACIQGYLASIAATHIITSINAEFNELSKKEKKDLLKKKDK